MTVPNIAAVQTALDNWWPTATPHQMRCGFLAAFLSNRWNDATAGYVRVSLVDGADQLGTAIHIEVETLAHVLVVHEFRPTTTRVDGLTLDDIEYLGATRAPLPNGVVTDSIPKVG